MTAFAHDDRRLAETYDRVSDLQLEAGQALIEQLRLQPGDRVLDVGCGTGRLTRWVAERAGAVTGLDPLPDRIDLARSRGGNARFHVGRAEDLSAFADASFDVVCLSAVLHWVADKEKALAEARRVLRPGGRLGLTTAPPELSRASTVGRALAGLPVNRSQLTFGARGCTTTELIGLIEASGLQLTGLHVVPSAHLHPSGAAVLDFIEASAFGTFLRPVPEERRQALRAELVAAFDAQRGPAGVALHGWTTTLVAINAPAGTRG